MEKLIKEINSRLLEIVDNYQDSVVKEAIKYSLMAGGKRIRPIMMLQVISSYGIDYHDYLDAACAVEMIHTYSLIHDDLPGMDNDDLRRGKPTCHRQFDEATAILAGDGLLNEAVNVILKACYSNDLKISLLQILYQASGINGMILGQVLDMEFENKKANHQELDLIHHHKTGDLISAAMKMGALVCDYKDMLIWQEIGYKIGLAFQIQDDILDVTGNSEILGKKVGSDLQNHKSTYVSLMGIDKSQTIVNQYFKEATELLYKLNVKHELILEIMEKLKKRVK
ncbi:polyprenyl synthetase family protein [Thomasclavelia cocleata]|jgi:geranylgeranyl diphosphate synthase type II|uniref:polyprenyl synthetase family protein n=1 Tax=Thomasclavelia cocleata TaxID=69824 RepID=UPI00242D83B5|nr:farnesyl diphosphate synthase [Thomasclavelia cocleata]MCI9130438.1 polyprenyl synthetase family protein [Thomasclavelia cocleata]MCI9629335.1 polyprenyl synthetase family protein [Thomasclavelia cocleata]